MSQKRMLKVLSLILSLILIITVTFIPKTVKANTRLSQTRINRLSNYVSNLNDSDFDAFLMDYINSNEKSGKTFKEIQEELSDVGVYVTMTSTSYNQNANNINNDVSPLYISPSKVQLRSYAAKRNGEVYYRVFSEVTFNQKELKPGGLDLLSVEWDYNKATYYKTSQSPNFVTYMDGSQRNRGICLFNVEDKSMWSGDYCYAVVYVKAKPSCYDIDIATKYIHTYNTTNVTWAVGVNVNYTAAGPTGGFSYSISGQNLNDTWQLFNNNAFR